MFWVTVSVSVIVSLAVCAVYVSRWRRRIRRDMETDAIIGKLRTEVGEIVTELNGTTERNVALIENRIALLNELIEKAGKSTGVLRRESEKHDIASQVYTSLEKSRPLTPSLNLVVDDEPTPGGFSAGSTDESRTIEAKTSTDSLSEIPSKLNLREPEAVDFASLPSRDKALFLHRNGESSEQIATSLNLSRGEVELIISVHDRRPR